MSVAAQTLPSWRTFESTYTAEAQDLACGLRARYPDLIIPGVPQEVVSGVLPATEFEGKEAEKGAGKVAVQAVLSTFTNGEAYLWQISATNMPQPGYGFAEARPRRVYGLYSDGTNDGMATALYREYDRQGRSHETRPLKCSPDHVARLVLNVCEALDVAAAADQLAKTRADTIAEIDDLTYAYGGRPTAPRYPLLGRSPDWQWQELESRLAGSVFSRVMPKLTRADFAK